MKSLWNKAKKEFVIGVDTAKGIFGVKNVTHDADVQEKVEVLNQMEENVNMLLKSFRMYLSSTAKLISSSSSALDTLTSSLQPSDGDFYRNGMQVNDLLQKYTQINDEMAKNQVSNNCITPLVEFKQHIKSLRLILDKAKKNKILFQHAAKSPEEQEKRQTKMDRYQTAFCRGVEILQQKQAAVYSGVFTAHQYDLLSLISDVKTRLPNQIVEFTSTNISEQLPPLEGTLEVSG
ncbi:hypothetical protein TRFO_33735 [Tritrichomonas foetus]|uniref:BAR domain-containing protein n=1 Tax=Tritrichomonas foetus TaxID=1144522 RepID=A0A1J4JM50_9EUKA|nr:hypothetical protein TRFO_33735 [Tritrichomonas foetus]|eukprot:OHS99769.1 hypothetical protein TRFO_33735 [Tritrichomonas foetus]